VQDNKIYCFRVVEFHICKAATENANPASSFPLCRRCYHRLRWHSATLNYWINFMQSRSHLTDFFKLLSFYCIIVALRTAEGLTANSEFILCHHLLLRCYTAFNVWINYFHNQLQHSTSTETKMLLICTLYMEHSNSKNASLHHRCLLYSNLTKS